MTAGALTLADRISALLDDAARVFGGTEWAPRLQAAALDVHAPLRVAMAGRVKAGKSTLLNALVGQEVAATDAGECTRVVTWYRHDDAVRAHARRRGQADAVTLPVTVTSGRLAIDLGALPATELDRIEVGLPNARLDGVTYIDTPGMASLDQGRDLVSRRYLGGQDDARPDAVIYLMRQLHTDDTDFLESFRDPSARAVPPVNAVGVISRADEVGGGRDDALEIAGAIATRYAREPRLRPLVQTVVPVAGLLAEASISLTPADYADLRTLAGLPAAVTDVLLLSAERVHAPRLFVPVPPQRRAELLDRLGLFGLRWMLSQLRGAGVADDDDTLARRLAELSGLTALQAVLMSRMVDRRDVLKADAALRLLRRAVAEHPSPGTRRVAAAAERLQLSVHDFAELELLNLLRAGALEVDPDTREHMERLLGSHGGSLTARLGAASGAGGSPEELAEELLGEHRRWRALAVDAWAPPDMTRAATVLERTVAGLRRDVLRAAADGPDGGVR